MIVMNEVKCFMYEWHKRMQTIVDEIDHAIRQYDDEALTLTYLSKQFGYSEYHMTRKFKEISGMQFRDYLSKRKLAFALKELRDSQKSILDIALSYGFSTHEAFSRAFKHTYGISPSAYRKDPKPIVLRSKLNPFDRYLLGQEEIGNFTSNEAITTYFITIPAHKFLFIKNDESNGYWDFWQKQALIPGQDRETICGLLDSIKGKLDDFGDSEANSGSGQLIAYISDPNGRLCDWGLLRSECYGSRLPYDYQGEIPSQMQMIDIFEAEYIVFEHGPFDYDQEKQQLEAKMEKAMAEYDFENSEYEYDTTPGRILYLYYDPKRCWKYVRPIHKK